mgnify:CR=1 FL=1
MPAITAGTMPDAFVSHAARRLRALILAGGAVVAVPGLAMGAVHQPVSYTHLTLPTKA